MYMYDKPHDPIKLWGVPAYTQLYYDGLAIEDFMLGESHYHGPTNTVVHLITLRLDDGSTFLWSSQKHQPPTTVVPRRYIKHINLKLLEDIDNGS